MEKQISPEQADYSKVLALACFCAALAGLLIHLWLLRFTAGSNDIGYWQSYAQSFNPASPLEVYQQGWWINHPPLALIAAWVALKSSILAQMPFSAMFKSMSVVCHFGIAIVLGLWWTRRSGKRRGMVAFIIGMLSPDLLLLSGYHGNTDVVCVFFALLSIYLLEIGSSALLAGVMFSVAINIKIVPLIALFPILSCFKNLKTSLSFLTGVSVVPLLTILCIQGDYWLVLNRVFSYRSYPGGWGVLAFMGQLGDYLPAIRSLFHAYHVYGPYIILAAALALSVVNARCKLFSPFAIASISIGGWLLLASGFGIQYVIYPTPFLLAVSLLAGSIYGLLGGFLLLLTYGSFLLAGYPIRSDHGIEPHYVTWPFRTLLWLCLLAIIAGVIYSCLRRSKRGGILMKWLCKRTTLVTLLMLMMGLNVWFVSQHPWWGDFWHHVGLVHALQIDLLPRFDPFMERTSALIPYWPYAALVAFFSNLSGLTAIQGMTVFGFINLAVLLVALDRFSRAFSSSILFFPVFFILLLGCWGHSPPEYSSFYHARVVFFVLSYPSTLAFGLSFLGISRIIERSSLTGTTSSIRWGDVALATLIVLIHPITFLFYLAVTLPLLVCRGEYRDTLGKRNLALLLLSPLIVWMLWIPFPLWAFLKNSYFSSDSAGAYLYTQTVRTIGIATGGFLLLIIRNSPLRRASLEASIVLLTGIYVYGYLTHQWNYGRALSFLMVMLQLAIAREIFDRNSETPRLVYFRRGFAVLLLCFSLVRAGTLLNSAVGIMSQVPEHSRALTARILPRQSQLRADGLMMADLDLAKILAAHGQKVLVFDSAPFFRDEFQARIKAQEMFFSEQASLQARYEVIRDYAISAILIDIRVPVQQQIKTQLEHAGKVEVRDLGEELFLLTFKPDPFFDQFRFKRIKNSSAVAPARKS